MQFSLKMYTMKFYHISETDSTFIPIFIIAHTFKNNAFTKQTDYLTIEKASDRTITYDPM